MKPKNEMLVASLFSLAVGLGAGIYGMSPSNTTALASPAQVLQTVKAEVAPLIPCSGSADGPYEYTSDWFTTENRLEAWDKHLKPLADKPVAYLEVGIYEGRSMIWMLENVLKHPDSRAVGVDVTLYARYLRNLLRSGSCGKVKNIQGYSQDVLKTLPKASFDLIYIDGSHLGQDVLFDSVLAFDLLKVGGMIVFDDYKWYTDWASDIRPEVAIDSFVTMYRHELEIVHRDYQMIVRKKKHPCEFNKFRFTPVGQYCYQWVSGALVKQSDGKPVKLLPGEREIIAEVASSHPFGQLNPALDKFKARPEFQAMNARLGLFK